MKDELQNNILPDEEDLTLVENLIKFKDRTKDPNKHTGRGYKILRLCNPESPTGNILQLSDIMDTNTIYEIRYDFDLNKQTIVIPINSVLYINGGSLSNGTIYGNGTLIINYNQLIIDNLLFDGTFITDSVYIDYDVENNTSTIKYTDLKGITHKIYNIFNIVLCFKESIDKPLKPQGGKFDIESDKLIPPEGWSLSCEDMISRIWVSSGRFDGYGNLIDDWSEPVIISNPKTLFRWESKRSNCLPSQIGKILISEDDGLSWNDLSEPFTNYLHIYDYVDSVDELPIDAAPGAIYLVGPTYSDSDVELKNPTYRMYVNADRGWVDNGIYNGVTAGVVQTIGDSTTEIMSLKAVTDEFKKSTYLGDYNPMQPLPELEHTSSDYSTKALQDWDGNDIREHYIAFVELGEINDL